MDPVKPIFDKWLLKDSRKKKKYLRTTKRMHDLLVKELELKGSANSDPREYVLKWILERLASA